MSQMIQSLCHLLKGGLKPLPSRAYEAKWWSIAGLTTLCYFPHWIWLMVVFILLIPLRKSFEVQAKRTGQLHAIKEFKAFIQQYALEFCMGQTQENAMAQALETRLQKHAKSPLWSTYYRTLSNMAKLRFLRMEDLLQEVEDPIRTQFAKLFELIELSQNQGQKELEVQLELLFTIEQVLKQYEWVDQALYKKRVETEILCLMPAISMLFLRLMSNDYYLSIYRPIGGKGLLIASIFVTHLAYFLFTTQQAQLEGEELS